MSESNSDLTPPPANSSQPASAANPEISDKSIFLVILFLFFLPSVHRLYVGKIGTGLLFLIFDRIQNPPTYERDFFTDF